MDMGVGLRTTVRRQGDLTGEHLIELLGELGIPIMDGQPDRNLYAPLATVRSHCAHTCTDVRLGSTHIAYRSADVLSYEPRCP